MKGYRKEPIICEKCEVEVYPAGTKRRFCDDCAKINKKEWTNKNVNWQKARAYSKVYRANNRERLRKTSIDWYYKNK